MSRKHFEALADALASDRPEGDDPDARSRRSQWDDVVRDVASVCARFNGNFDRGRFVTACEERFST